MVSEEPDRDAEEVAARGYDPNVVDLEPLEQAELMFTAGEIPDSAIRATAERLTVEYREYLVAYQAFLDHMDAMAERSQKTNSPG
jgi:hypothetical protein